MDLRMKLFLSELDRRVGFSLERACRHCVLDSTGCTDLLAVDDVKEGGIDPTVIGPEPDRTRQALKRDR